LSRISDGLKRKAIQIVSRADYVTTHGLRSWSDDGFYPEFAREAAKDSHKFSRFRRNPIYRRVLEHVSEQQGSQYLSQIETDWPDLIGRIQEFKANDSIGSPLQYSYPRIGAVSPTTLRYIKVACDLRRIFGDLNGFRVAEIGCGYGGQFLIADMIWPLRSWTLFDLDPVLQLISRYLESFLVRSAYEPMTLNRFDSGEGAFDLLISNYAFSELPRALQAMYVEKVLSKAKRGYMTMNSGKTEGEHFSIAQLGERLPNLKVLDEVPLTAPNNYILVWNS
jgi:putative sugar O-methyltransferase